MGDGQPFRMMIRQNFFIGSLMVHERHVLSLGIRTRVFDYTGSFRPFVRSCAVTFLLYHFVSLVIADLGVSILIDRRRSAATTHEE